MFHNGDILEVTGVKVRFAGLNTHLGAKSNVDRTSSVPRCQGRSH